MSSIRLLTRCVALAPLLAASACSITDFRPQALTPTEQFAPRVETAPDQLALAIHAQGGLSGAQTAALAAFAARWRESGGGVIVLRSPDGAPADEGQSTIYYARSALENFGVPSAAIRQDHYAPEGPGPAPLLASFEGLHVIVPDCARQWDNLTATGGNRVHADFGCAVTANLAVQTADPRDLIAPPPLAAGDNMRREIVLGKYRDGRITASDKDIQASGAVSTAVQQ